MRLAILTSLCVLLTVPVQAAETNSADGDTALQIQISNMQNNDAEATFKQNASLPTNNEIRQTIEEQLRAIRDRDDRTAYNLSSVNVEKEYGSAHDFMRGLRREKPSLYNHVYYEILPSSNNEKFQKVKLIDSQGKEALAMFKMQQDEAGRWRTSKILILKTEEDPI